MLAHATAQRSEELVAQIDMDVLRTLPEGHEIMFGNPAVKQVHYSSPSVLRMCCVCALRLRVLRVLRCVY